MVTNLQSMFDKHKGEHRKFERIDSPISLCPDICAFLLLAEIGNHSGDMIATATHDVIYLAVDPRDIEGKITEDQVVYLLRCGVLFDEAEGSFFKFV